LNYGRIIDRLQAVLVFKVENKCRNLFIRDQRVNIIK